MRELCANGNIPLPDARLVYDPNFLSRPYADALLSTLLGEAPWRQDEITLFGKTFPQPRLTALYGNNGKSYTYSGIQMRPMAFPSFMLDIKQRVEEASQHNFTTCLLNLYRDGNDSNGWHADNEKELGKNPVIASVSLGTPRVFHIKHRRDKVQRYRLTLGHGSLLVMAGPMQHHWLHQVPKSRKPLGKRINLTFRTIL